jgi:hypothetical protein
MNLIRILTLALIIWLVYRLISSSAEIITDTEGNAYCSEAHRNLGSSQRKP